MGDNRAPAFVGAVLVHVLVFGAGLFSLPYWGKPIQLEDAVPITIVSRAPPAAPTAKKEAPTLTPETAPEPQPTPEPAPPPPPAPAPSPKPTAQPTRAEAKPLDLNALAKSLPQAKAQPNRNAKASSRSIDLGAIAASLPKSSGARGRLQPSTGPAVNLGPPKPLSGDELGAVTAKLVRLWHPNCGAEGVGKVVVQVEMKLSADGRLTSPPRVLNQPLVDAAGPVAQASAQRALSAVQQGQPYTELPRDRYMEWRDIVVGFDARHACSLQ
jgi:hypothetical protein